MKKYANISNVILTILRDNPDRDFALEELSGLIFPTDPIQEEKHNQAAVLDVLIFLDDQKMILLDFETDRSRLAK
ncbi:MULTISPECIES: hypothetical protein [Flavobacterium]|uniref:Uncharacterized protein n=1 Tax=Flavobacterium hibernum TaxID=37752 RepID=A0A0D0F9F6_9FLAO|nr:MULTISPECIES: hypothetical protein [Flavobacterium]KIO54647.1 hypothetical protein IW18_01180 [Flavobacterium hibernum]OXA84718.1 hypothetical protein B0A73_19090 [Flavobacterium hibernum]